MAELGIAVASSTMGNLATEYASPYLSYFFRFGKIVEDFKNRRNQLELRKIRVENDVAEAKKQTQVIEKDVEEWLTRAEKKLGEAQSLEDEIERNKCFNWCPSWGWRYCLSIEVAKKTLCISQLLENSNFERVGYRATLPGLEFIPSKDFMSSESSNSAFKEIMEALNNGDVNMIGLYGMGGVGKTTLAKEVGNQAKQLFDKVEVVTVSQNPNINNIQDKIADFLDLDFQKKTPEGRAEQLWLRIKDEKSILIILDDVWEELDLKIIGIPFGDDHKGCKIFLTTRLQEVCTRMHCQREVLLKILSDDEAWALFKDSAGLKDNSPTLKVAKEVALEGKGLPLAIVTMAKALKDESLDGWIAANLRLKESRHLDNQHVCGGIYKCLKLSYDYLTEGNYNYLKEDNIQSCFLLCSLFLEDREISVALLTVFGIGLGLFGDINLIENLRREIRLALSKLQKSGLLLQTDDEESVKMHDVVRDFAHWITSTGEKMFMVKNKLTEWPNSENFDCYTAISLWNSKIDNFPERLEFSKLKTLILSRMDCQIVPSTFFEGMNALQILFLEHLEFSMEAFKFLTNLRIMRIVKCGLQEDISSLRNLKNLEFLELTSVRFEELPEELLELRRLKSLYFSCSGDGPINVPPNLLSRLTSLQELHVPRDNNANLLELNSLSRLTTLTLIVSTDQCFQENFVFPKLQSYSIAVNAYIEFPEKRISRILTISDCSSLNAFKELFPNVQKLTLFKVMEHKTVVPNVDQWGLNELTSLQLTSCDDLECLIDTTWEQSPTTAFSNLVNLDIGKMTSLKELCNGQSPNSFLQNLETLIICDCGQLQSVFQMNGQMLSISNLRSLELQSLPALESIWKEPTHYVSLQSLKDVKVDGCDKLKSIFSPYLAQSLLHLEQLKISACKKLEQVFAFAQDMAELEENQAPPLSNLICLELESVPELRCIWREPTHLVKLKSLKTMRIGSCSKLEYLFSPTLAQALVHLEELKIKESNSLKHLIMEAENGDEIVSNKERSLLCWPKLKSLEIASCKSLRYVFPITLAQGLPYLESVQIIDCPQLMHVFNMAKEEDKHDIMLPKLQFLRLEDLENLRSFCPRNCFVKLPSFKGLEASNVGARPQVMSHSQNQQGLTWQYQLKDIEINAVKELLYNVKSLALTRVMYHKNLVPNVDPKGLNELTFLALKDGKELECLIDTTEGHVSTSAFFNLVELVIQDMTSMKMLCNGQFPKGFLQKLEKLEATNCMEMVSLSPALQDLKEVKVINCGQLQEVFQIDELLHDAEEPLLSNLALMELHLLPELKWIWKGSTHFVRLQSLKYLAISFCNSLKYLFSPSLAQSLVLLEHLNIYHCYGLQHIINELDCDDGIEPNAHLHSPFLPKLETLTISNCPKLEYVFQISLAQVPPRLKFVSISDSPQLQQVFNVAKEKHGVDRAIALPCLQQLQLGNLINLSCFFSENFLITYPSLENLVFSDCPKLTNFTIQKEVNEQAQLKDLGLHAMKDLLYNAKSLTLKGVMYQKNLVPNVDPKGLNELTFLLIKDGKELECLIDTTEGHVSTNAFFNLVQLVIQEMTGFKMLCNGRIPKGFLQKLEKLEATNCMEMVSLSPMLQNLKEVKVINCGQLQEVFQTDEILHDTKENQGPLLSNLTLMELHSLPELKLIWKGSTHFVSLQSLMFVEISYCNRLKYLFSPFLAQSLVLLEQLKIDHCNGLQHIITELEFDDEIESEDHPYSPLLPKLETLTISDCPKLEYVFQTPLAQVLPRLKFVWISNSPQLQQLFNVTKEENGVGRAIVLPCLQDLRLGNLINLSCFCSKNFLIAASSLEKLVVFNCLKLSNFTIQKEVNQQAQLKELYLSDLGNDKGCNTINSQSRWSLVNLEYITVGNCVKIFQMQAGQFFSRVENIQLEHLHQLQGPIQVASLQCLRWLHMSKCNRLKYLLSPMLVRNLPHLTHLEINHCEELEQIIEMDQTSASSSQAHLQPISFPSLEIIRIYKCSNLKSLFPLSITCSPSKVKIISIDGASKLERVFNLDVEDDQKGIVLPNLQGLLLKELPSLKSLSQGYHFRFPCMHYAEVKECPKLNTSFSIDSKRVVHAITEAPEQVENDRREGLITKEEIVDNQAACNDVFWLCGYQEETLPLYMNVDEAEDN